jgi:hypothetical protein
MDFLSITDQFFLNLAMAACKAAMDAGAQVRAGSIVTAMTRNGDMFGIRVSGWRALVYRPGKHTAGLFFTGFTQDQANPDMGDSAITETFGIGGAAMIAALASRVLSAQAAWRRRNRSQRRWRRFSLSATCSCKPGWDFQGPVWGWIFAGWWKPASRR